MKRIIAVLLLLVMMISLTGCGLIKPKDILDEFMKQENLIDCLAVLEESSLDEDDDNYDYQKFLVDIINTPSIKSLLLDNVRSIRYNITDDSTNGKNATITTLITHFDISPVVDKAMEDFSDQFAEMDRSKLDGLENEEIIAEIIYPMILKSLKEAAGKIKPIETYTKIKFEFEENSAMQWELIEIPDDFYSQVLLMNLLDALENGFDSLS